MTSTFGTLNLTAAWLLITIGFVSGAVLGKNYHRDDWLGGYGSLKRRLYRLGHIAFFGMGIINLLFHLTAQQLAAPSQLLPIASWGFVVGGATMSACCLLVAHRPRMRNIFALPVVSLIVAGAVTLWEVLRL